MLIIFFSHCLTDKIKYGLFLCLLFVYRALKHTMLDEDTEIALFVKDLKRGRRLDSEPTIAHYEQLLREKGVTKFRITVIPMNQLYNEYATFELRRKLSYLYDKFLADASIAAHVNGFLGTKMLQKGRLAMPVNLKKDDLNAEFDRALRQVFYKHTNQGITQSIQIGKHHMSDEHVAENVIDVLQRIGDIHPGGYKNISKLFLRPQTNVSVSIPIFAATGKHSVSILCAIYLNVYVRVEAISQCLFIFF